MPSTLVKQTLVATPHTNGVVAMPIKTVTLKLDEIGYIGWEVTLRINPRAEHYDLFLNSNEDTSWEGFGHIVVAWNFGDEDGKLLPLPKDGLEREKLPHEVLWFIYNKYIDAFNSSTILPKQLSATSSDTSQTDVKNTEDTSA